MTQFMIIERFDPTDLEAIYERLHTKGRGLPEGLYFVNSWLTDDNSTVYQVMETENEKLFEVWFEYWADLVRFEKIKLRTKPVA